MSRCGCESGFEVKPGCGIHTTGTGEPEEDPLVIDVDPAALAGDGLKPQGPSGGEGCQLSADLVPGGGISFDPNGAMYCDECVPSVDPSRPSVPALVSSRANDRNITGAYLGGYLHKPQSTRAAVRTAVERGYDLLHLPVRFLHDGTPVITPDPMLGRQNGNTRDFGQDTPVQHQTPDRWRALYNDAGVSDPRTGNDGKPDDIDPDAGWFGYLEQNEIGLLTLAEAVEIVDKRVPMVWELQWPITPDEQGKPAWTKGQEVPPQRVDAFVRHLQHLLRNGGNQNYMILTSQYPQVPGTDPAQPRDILSEIGAAHTGPALYEAADADRNPPGGGQQQQQRQAA